LSISETFEIPEPPFLRRLFGARKAVFVNTPDGVLVRVGDAQEFMLDHSRIGDQRLSRGALFSSAVLVTQGKPLRLAWINKSVFTRLYSWLYACLFQHYGEIASATAQMIRKEAASRYLREVHFVALRVEARARVAEFGSAPAGLDKSTIPCLSDLIFLSRAASWSASDLAEIRRSYVERCLEQHGDFFDSVESNPLTQKQREACIVDEENNLVLAGAGTGKTSTMIGRAGFLLQSKQAKPEEILMLAFARKAAEEMQERLNQKLGEDSIEVSTFHKLGKEIIASVEGAQPSLSPLAEDDQQLAKQANTWFEGHMQRARYRKKVLAYFERYLYAKANPFEFESEGEYLDFIIENDIRTLKGELVKGVGECLIANHLFKLGVEYQYEPAYEHETRDLDFRQYQPDFYLPDNGIYIEHFGICRDGGTAPYVDKTAYHRGMEWKRELHEKQGTILVETYFYEHSEGILLEELERKLEEHEVKFEPIPPDAQLETLYEFGAVTGFADLLTQMLKSYKRGNFDSTTLDDLIQRSAEPGQMRAALDLLQPIIGEYESCLANEKQIDFDDMIGKALAYVEAGRYKPRWKFILVDEFQDISAPRARLVKALKDGAEGCSLFCVGDDWQSIYRFTGSDITFTTNFEKYFGVTQTSALDLTFRFNSSICDVAERFVLQNPAQVKKHIDNHIKVQQPAVSLLRADNRGAVGSVDSDPRLLRVLDAISSRADEPATVYVLSRYGFLLPDKRGLARLNKNFENLSIEALTIHGSKGKEADYVVLLGLETGKYGFPSQKVTHPLLDALLPRIEPFAFAEERRLFYVAITRARERAYLISDMSVASEFTVELIKERYPIELDEFETSLAQKVFEKIKCRKCVTGTLVPRNGRRGLFYGCSHYPLCDYAENGCPICNSPMERRGNFKICTSPDCNGWVPLCPKCGGQLAQRSGRYGQFLGCRNFRRGETVSCDYTVKAVEAPDAERFT
jgi:DNA helicase-4